MQASDPLLGQAVAWTSQGLAVLFTVFIMVAMWRSLPKFWGMIDELKAAVKEAMAENARQNLLSQSSMGAANTHMHELTRLLRQQDGRIEKLEDNYSEMRRDQMVAFDRVERAIREAGYPAQERRTYQQRGYAGEEKRRPGG